MMAKWINKNLTLSVIITLLIGYGIGAAWAATVNVQISSLKTIPERMARLEQKVDDVMKFLIIMDKRIK